MIIAGYDAILDQSDQQNLYNHLSNYTNDTYTMAAKLIKFLELHYSMIQFLIIYFIRSLATYGGINDVTICHATCHSILTHTLALKTRWINKIVGVEMNHDLIA